MIKKKEFLVIILLLLLIPFLYGQAYSITIQTQFSIRYSGDYSGVFKIEYEYGERPCEQEFIIGPFEHPFAVQLEALNSTEFHRFCGAKASGATGYSLENWIINRMENSSNVAVVQAGSFVKANWNKKLEADWFHPRNGAMLWLSKKELSSPVGELFKLQLETYACQRKLRDYDLDIIYDPEILEFDKISCWHDFNNSSYDTSRKGRIKIFGKNEAGIGLSSPKILGDLTWKVLKDNKTEISIMINKYLDLYKKEIKYNPLLIDAFMKTECTVINPHESVLKHILGDVDVNGEVTIVDALLVAKYCVGIKDPVFVKENADFNKNKTINIVDALLMAQFYTGLLQDNKIYQH